MRCLMFCCTLLLGWTLNPLQADEPAGLNVPPEGFRALFNGQDLSGWKVNDRILQHWKVIDGVLDYNPMAGDLWTEDSFTDFVLMVDWRLKTAQELYGTETEPDGSPIAHSPDSGIYLRGSSKAQTNIWVNPLGSGEVWGYRTDQSMPESVRQGVTPSVNADKPVGQWNRKIITMQGDRLTVVLNGQTVIENAQLPGVPPSGPIALQHHGRFDEASGRWVGGPSCVQFRNIFIKELPTQP
ncbi:MAG: DUF1080 domain-containing protein [Planctomycetaceae bacterium]|nr:MAG: DUF1080 domain-containing protein [Planctomycetaceae bacterium]